MDKTGKEKRFLACLESDVFAYNIVLRIAEEVDGRAGQKIVWRNEAACWIGRIETEAPNTWPVLCIGSGLPNLASLGGREDCRGGACVLVVSRANPSLPLGLPGAEKADCTFVRLDQPVFGFNLVVLPTVLVQFQTKSFAGIVGLSLYEKFFGEGGLPKFESFATMSRGETPVGTPKALTT